MAEQPNAQLKASPEQVLYAKILEKGMLIGLILLLITFALYGLGISLCYNLVGATLALAGLVSPLVAAVLMPLSSLAVVISSVSSRPFGRSLQGQSAPLEMAGREAVAWR